MLGGTFDPPHWGHLALAEAARVGLALDRVVFVPAGDPYMKRDREITPGPLRLALTRAAIGGLDWAEVSTVDLDRAGPTYTADTLADLVQPGEEWWCILGADALAELAEWRDPARIVALARLAVAARPDAVPPVPSEELRVLAPGIEERIDLVPMEPVDLSSSEIRAVIRDGDSTEGMLPLPVRALIDGLGLYRD